MQPGDNFRVLASPVVDRTGNYTVQQIASMSPPPLGGSPDAPGDDPVTHTLTVWRRLHIERDSMTAPPATEVFDGTEDVDPGDIPPPTITESMRSQLQTAYVEVVDLVGEYNPRPELVFIRNLDLSSYQITTRDQPCQADYWVAHWVGAYEGLIGQNGDTEPTRWVTGKAALGSCFIFRETIRDLRDTMGDSLREFDVLWGRVAFHETVHCWGLPDAGAGMDGIIGVLPNGGGVMDYDNVYKGEDGDLFLNLTHRDRIMQDTAGP